ncbi:hypothetical protein CBR_g49588 [Chara braunii]|uniref:HECT-type E3 ubiquitin transferase n=1 Tax=Chara braunii TaxID=69332 RepID=A0A388M5C0_CHABU|nr:hypothetical protein CBR_g49588 [Chara braunii]|eukprot:GBG89736.1 hypothetical protein CBR_g49588 [Chara braunii]
MSETGAEGEGMDMDLTGGQADKESEGKDTALDAASTEEEDGSMQSWTWLRDYVEWAKREREHAFDIRVAFLKHAERSQAKGKRDASAGSNSSSNQYEILKKVKTEEFSEYEAFRYAEKKRARERGTEDKDKTIPTTEDNFEDLRPKARKLAKNKKRKETNNDQTEAEEKSERDLLEKEVEQRASMVSESAKAARRTLRNIRPLIAARYVSNAREWQIATDIAFKIPHFVEGENVVKVLKEHVTLESLPGLFETVALESDLIDSSAQEETGSVKCGKGKMTRNSPRAFSPLIAKMLESTTLRTRMIWKPWRTVAEVPYSILAGIGVLAELMATTVAQIVKSGQLEGDEDLDARAVALDCDRFYRSDASDCSEWEGDDEGEIVGRDTDLGKQENGQIDPESSDKAGDSAFSPSKDNGLGSQTISERADLLAEFRKWRHYLARGERDGFVSFCQTPFLLMPEAKCRILQVEAEIEKQTHQQHALAEFLLAGDNHYVDPFLVLTVDRDRLVARTLGQLQQIATVPRNLKKPLKVIFDGEEGVDEGGVMKEFFQLLIRDLFNVSFGGGRRKLDESGDLRGVHADTISRDNVAKALHARGGKSAFAKLSVELLLAEDGKDLLDALKVGLEAGTEDKDVVEVDHDTDFKEIVEDVVHGGVLEGCWGICEAERRH